MHSPQRRKAALAAAVVLAGLLTASTAAAQAPRACAILTKPVAAALLGESPKALVDQPLVCSYGRSSERAATLRTTVSLLLVRNPSVAVARRVQRATENAAPRKAAGGVAGFTRAKLPAPGGGEAFAVYFYVPGAPGRQTSASGFGFLRLGALTAQLTADVPSRGAPAFTAPDLRRAIADVFAAWSRRG